MSLLGKGRDMRAFICATFGTVLVILGTSVCAEQIFQREQEIPDLRLGQRVMIDDGTCPAGQIKQLTGSKLTPTGVTRTSSCVPRLGTRKR
jgi:hypothetical protein